jgi:restriction endonuclease S subunit
MATIPQLELVPTEVPGLFRDTKTGAIINKNVSELNQYRANLDQAIEQEKIKTKLETLDDDIREIKSLLKLMVQSRNGNCNS